MHTLLSWKIIACAVGIFVAGGITGGVVGKAVSDARIKYPPSRSDYAGRMFSKLQEMLELTPEQERTIKPIVDETSAQLRTIQLATMNQAADILSESNTLIASELTPTQQKKLREMERERRERMKKWGRERSSDDRKDHKESDRDGDGKKKEKDRDGD